MKTLIRFELKKIFSKRLTQAALLALLLLSVLLTGSTYWNMYAFDEKCGEGTGRKAVEIDQAVAARYAGTLTDQKVRRMMADFAPDPSLDLHGMNAAYLYQNATQSAVFARFSDLNGHWNGASVSDVFGEEEIRIGYSNGWLETSQNMVKLFTTLLFVVILMTGPAFCGEYGGTDNLILTSRCGRTTCTLAKIFASLLSGLLVTAALSLLNFSAALVLYGGGGLSCSILFAPSGFTDGYIPFNITCGALLGYQILLAFTAVLSITGITLVLSAVCKNQPAALAASAAFLLVPMLIPIPETNPLFRYLALLPLYQVQLLSLMSIEQLGCGLLYAVWAVPAALLFGVTGSLASRRIFAKHQVL